MISDDSVKLRRSELLETSHHLAHGRFLELECILPLRSSQRFHFALQNAQEAKLEPMLCHRALEAYVHIAGFPCGLLEPS